MESSKLTVEQLIEIANKADETESTPELSDMSEYLIDINLQKGNYRLSLKVLYLHYTKWSKSPVDYNYFCVIIKTKVDYKYNTIFVNREGLNINMAKAVGDYIKNEKKRKEEKRLRQICSIKSKTKR